MDCQLQVVTLPVSDGDQAKVFYTQQAEPGGVNCTTRKPAAG